LFLYQHVHQKYTFSLFYPIEVAASGVCVKIL
jgi:hypothetical protein